MCMRQLALTSLPCGLCNPHKLNAACLPMSTLGLLLLIQNASRCLGKLALLSVGSRAMGPQKQQMEDHLVCLQAAWRMHRVLRYTAAVRAAVCIQKHWAMLLFRRAMQQHRAAIAIQACWRGFTGRQLAIHSRAARHIQSCWRGWATRQSLLCHRSATLIQRFWQARRQRHAFCELRRCCTKVTSMVT